MDDPVIQEINRSFDLAEHKIKDDVFDDALLDLYKNLEERAANGEFSKEQLGAILKRYRKTKGLIDQMKSDVREQALSNTNRHSQIKQYIKNSFSALK